MLKQNTEGDRAGGSLHAGEFGVADEVFLEVGIEWALAAEPGEGAFGFGAELDLGRFRGLLPCSAEFDFDFDQVGAGCASGAGASVHAASGDDLGLGERVGGEGFQDGQEILVGDVWCFAAVQSADEAFRDAGGAGDIGLSHAAALGLAMKGGAEVGHGGKKAKG